MLNESTVGFIYTCGVGNVFRGHRSFEVRAVLSEEKGVGVNLGRNGIGLSGVGLRGDSWSPSSWRGFPARQQPVYENGEELEEVEQRLRRMPGLVSLEEVDRLQSELADVCRGQAFLLQGGDCAESLTESAAGITDTIRALFKMAVVLLWGSFLPVVKVGRVGGQFAKPRSEDFENRGGVSLPSYRGEIINGPGFTLDERTPDPQRMLRAYNHSAGGTNLVRALSSGGFADLRNVKQWGLADWSGKTQGGQAYFETARKIEEAMKFMEACGIESSNPIFSSTTVYTSHEGLLLPYEEGLVRREDASGRYFASSGHLIWIGERTRQLDGAHVEFFRGLSNPIAVKVGPTMKPDELLTLCEVLNPSNIPGRLTLISRMGSSKIETGLPPLLRAVKREGREVVWVCDPMHGNTYKTPSGFKTRSWSAIMQEVRGFFDAHALEGTHAGGVHFEMTGREVTECVGGTNEITEDLLKERYESLCDPRLNFSQSLELAFEIAEILEGRRM
uniref:Phospho-2-dehydro-3-deoxyheptonate aldolase n=2 Tax=Compsopogon caeruleus TaxID=31354 RepID=A0A7S1XF38_9RHOD|eukprot:CAMPEP_0184685434 /NCGR_PEP_ID=MMETSP0312-20130426/18946_1 /TAXON_ID=31354 /ORGANISM="Compsopogon coeruleus, Strain SAG 36.94" /LENGTH=502 /DNA_ID=CAMNT_0027139533 /DNA_START=66 /DNA_END=1574 /DNA_ORIENTATION=+